MEFCELARGIWQNLLWKTVGSTIYCVTRESGLQKQHIHSRA